MIDIDNQSNLPLPLDTLKEIHASLSDRELELLIVDDEQIKQINAAHRHIDKATDVLSFPMDEYPMAPLGSIVISSEHVIKVSQRLGHSTDDEICLLFIHGLLHLLGYDHETDQGEMRQKEEELIRRFELPASLIVRTQG